MHPSFALSERTKLNRRQVLAAIMAGVTVTPFARLQPARATSAVLLNEHSNRVLREDTKMKSRKLGTLEVSQLGAGCMSISANYGPTADRQQGMATLREAH